METYPGSWRLFTVSAVHLSSHWFTLVDTSYANNLQFIKNKSHKDSLKTPNKLGTILELLEINQMVNFYVF